VGNKKDDSCSIQKSSFSSKVGFFKCVYFMGPSSDYWWFYYIFKTQCFVGSNPRSIRLRFTPLRM